MTILKRGISTGKLHGFLGVSRHPKIYNGKATPVGGCSKIYNLPGGNA